MRLHLRGTYLTRAIVAVGPVALLALPLTALAQSASASPASLLPSGIFMSTQDSAIGTGPGKAITFPVDVLNNTPKIERISLSDDGAPQGWNPVFQDGSKDVSQLELLPGKDDTVTFQVTPPADAPQNTQTITLKSSTDDGLSATLNLGVQITGQATSGLTLTTNYANLRGTAGSKFEFAVTINNNTGKDNTFNLSVAPPSTDWQVFFQQTGGTTAISSAAVKSGATQDVNLEVTAPSGAKPDDYPLNVDVTDDSGNDAKAQLKVTIVGDYKLDLSTSTQQFSGQVARGQADHVTLLIQNTGNATLENVALSADNVPKDWNVSFQPTTVDSVDPGATSQVQATLTPASGAAAGDYSLTFTANNAQATISKDYRLTVQSPSILGWVGVGVAVVLVGGLVWVFRAQSMPKPLQR